VGKLYQTITETNDALSNEITDEVLSMRMMIQKNIFLEPTTFPRTMALGI